MHSIRDILPLFVFCCCAPLAHAQGLASMLRPEILGDHIDTFRYFNQDTRRDDFRLIKATLYKRVEKMPVFIGCEIDPDPEECSKKKLIDLLYNNIHYPAEAKKQRIQGVVYAKYVVRQDGSVGNARIDRGIGGGCDEEVLRFISLLPRYTPGYQDGKAVPVQMTLPVKFRLMK
ncbi:MAG: energy transducer TonB [Saprospiraceae bacterium]|nr:energy transducer TonB [Saprospiraceae bacterium]